MYRTIELLGSPDLRADVVEDADGSRILRIPTTTLPLGIWQQAYDLGVALILVCTQTGISGVSTTKFIQTRKESLSQRAYEVVVDCDFSDPEPSYRQYLMSAIDQETAAAEADPFEGVDFVHLHTHSEHSALDGLSTISEIIETIQRDPRGGGALALADHGNCAGHPEQQALCDEAGIKPIFAMEAYFVPDRFRRSESWMEVDGVRVSENTVLTDSEKKRAEKKNDSREVRTEYTHITLYAMNQVGLRHLWAMSTEAYADGLYDGKPRLDWDTLERLNEGVMCGTGCLRGPVARPLITGDVEAARQNLLRLHAIFEDRLYIEIHSNALEDQVKVNQTLVEFCGLYGIEPIAAVDSHYAVPQHKQVHQTWIAMATGKTLAEETSLFAGGQDYHLKTADEVERSLSYLDSDFVARSMANTVAFARRCEAKVAGEVTTPTYSKASKEHPDPVARDVERLIDICLANWERKATGKSYDQATAMARFEREMALLVSKGFCGYFLIVWDYVSWAKSQGCLVGPGRGSGGGSFVAYLADIVEIDPIESDLIFERFLTEGRKSLPDFDIDFPTSWRDRILTYLYDRWGTDYVSNIGTVSRIRTKATLNDVVRVMKGVLPYEVNYKDFENLKNEVSAADRPLAGKHLPWDEFQVQYPDVVEPMRAAYPDIFEVVDVVVDRVKTYGKHAAGVVISTSGPLTDLPMRLTIDSATKKSVMVTQFDMNALEILGYVKFDILTLRTLDTLQNCIDLISETYSHRVNPYDWKIEFEDPQVWSEVSEGRTLGLFQIETASGTRLTKRMQPANLFDLAAVMTVVRPGPMRSGLTESYLRRRAGIEQVTYIDPRLEDFLGDTFGSMIYQEQVMATCMNLAGYDSTEADTVRKLLGKKQVEKVLAAGEEFVRRAVEHGTDQTVAETLWGQMAEFAKYGFNKAHAFGYAVLGYWCAWLRFHYPREFLVAALSTVDMDRVPEFVEDCRRCGYGVVPPDVNRSQALFSSEGIEVIYGLSLVKGIGYETAQQIAAQAPYESLDDFMAKTIYSGSKVDMGTVRTLVSVGAFDSVIGNRKALEAQLEREASGDAKRCVFKVDVPISTHPFNLPCVYEWDQEPNPPMLPRGRGKAKTYEPKPPPKKCTVGCRQYTKPEPISADSMLPYTREEIMWREKEMLGCWISYSPFDFIPRDVLDDPICKTAEEIEQTPSGGGAMIGAALVEEVKKRRDKNGGEYAFVKMNMQDGIIEAICFASVFSGVGNQIRPNRMGLAQIVKTPKGYQLSDYAALN